MKEILKDLLQIEGTKFIVILALASLVIGGSQIAIMLFIACCVVLATVFLLYRFPEWVKRILLKYKFTRMLLDTVLTAGTIGTVVMAGGGMNLMAAAFLAGIMFSIILESYSKNYTVVDSYVRHKNQRKKK